MTNLKALKAPFKTKDLISLSLKRHTTTSKPQHKKVSYKTKEIIEKAPSEVRLTHWHSKDNWRIAEDLS